MVNKLLKYFGLALRRVKKKETVVVPLQPKKPNGRNVLLSYVIDPFLVPDEASIPNTHQHHWLSWKIAHTFLKFGYAVDVVDYRDYRFEPSKSYDFFVGARTNFQRIGRLLNKDCFKIVHLDTAHWLFNNLSAYKRCRNLQARRGVTIASHKMVEDNWAIESADMATANLGNQFNVGTYAYAKKPIYQIPIPSVATYPWPDKKNHSKCRKSFLWFGSGGLLHKGLDLVLDAFSEMPDFYLTICGPLVGKQHASHINRPAFEPDFEDTFSEELYNTPNIRTVGWVDVDSPEFIEILNSCIAIVYPSCSEGGAGSVLTCMQAGLIPCVSFESNIEVNDFGTTLKNSSIDEIKKAVQTIGTQSPNVLAERSRKAWEFARQFHNRSCFAKEYEKFVENLITKSGDAMKHNESILAKYRNGARINTTLSSVGNG